MMTLTLVSGNPGKQREWQRLMPSEFNFESADINLDEIQSLDLEAIAVDKAKRAYEHLGRAVVVDDISAGLVKLQGLPGPFIKFFETSLGEDAMYQLSTAADRRAIVTCCIAYYDGTNTITARGEVLGRVVSERGENGFGFDTVFIPDGSNETFAQMTPAVKDTFSHRAKAIKALCLQLKEL
jgi:inosine triphosphate pyrophosphatase